MSDRTARATVEEMIRVTLANSAELMGSVYAPDVVIEIPFAPPGMPTRYEGLAGLQQRWASVQEHRSFTDIDEITIHETPDPERVIAEYRVHGVIIATGATFALRFLMITTVRDGLIVESRDFSDVIGAARAYGRLPQLAEMLSQG